MVQRLFTQATKNEDVICFFYPELLDQVHIGPLVLLHAALRDTGHVCRQRAINKHTQHVQYCCEQLTVGEE